MHILNANENFEDEVSADEGDFFGAVELGSFLLLDERKIVGLVYVYKRLNEYNGQEYYIGGLGGLVVMPEYRGKGYARQLVEKALQMSHEIGVDVACLFIEREDTFYKFYRLMTYR